MESTKTIWRYLGLSWVSLPPILIRTTGYSRSGPQSKTTMLVKCENQGYSFQDLDFIGKTYWKIIRFFLVGGIPTPLKNDGVRQLGWFFAILESHKIPWFQSTDQFSLSFFLSIVVSDIFLASDVLWTTLDFTRNTIPGGGPQRYQISIGTPLGTP